MPSLYQENRITYIKYSEALFDQRCSLEATKAIAYRFTDNPTKKELRYTCNVATVTLHFIEGLESITETEQSSGTQNTTGHSERRALAKAINKAIDLRVGEFKGLFKINNTSLVSSEELNRFKSALKSVSSITVYTERVPCTKSRQEGIEPCDIFFAKLFEGVNSMFYYSVKLALGNEMEQTLKKEAEEAYSFYEKQKPESSIKHPVFVDNSSHLKKIEKEESAPSVSTIISTVINVSTTRASGISTEQFLEALSATPSAPTQKSLSLDERLESQRDPPKLKKLKQPTLMEMGFQLKALEQNIVSQPEKEETELDITTKTSEQAPSLSSLKEDKELERDAQQTSSSSNTTETAYQGNVRSQSSSKGPCPS